MYCNGEIFIQGQGTGLFADVSANGLHVDNKTLSPGATTETTLSAMNSKFVTGTVIGDVNAIQGSTWNINNIGGAITLPTGASTSALQTTGNTSLTNIYTRQADKTQFVKITDGTNDGSIDSSGNLHVITAPPTPPAATTAVSEGGQTTIVKNGGTNSHTWIVPNGETFTIQRFTAGGYIPNAGTVLHLKVELWWQPNGNTTGEELIDVIYLQGQSDGSRILTGDYDGDGTARFLIQSECWSAKDGEIIRYLRGYY